MLCWYLQIAQGLSSNQSYYTLRNIGSTPQFSFAASFFDGAAIQGTGGAGIILFISTNNFYHVKLGCVKITNTCAKLLAFWALLLFSSYIGLLVLNTFGDSIIITDWANHSSHLQVLDLDQWCAHIKDLKRSLLALSFSIFTRIIMLL